MVTPMSEESQPPRKPDLSRLLSKVRHAPTAVRLRGRVREITGLVAKASVPGASLGEVVSISVPGRDRLRAVVVGFSDELVVLMPFGDLDGVSPDSAVEATGKPLTLRCGPGLLGRVLDGLGEPIDGLGELDDVEEGWAIDRLPPSPMLRQRIVKPFITGVRAIDGLVTLGEGQRVGLFAGSGVGKSSLLGQLARGASADVTIIALVGERGRELRDFVEETLGAEGLRRSVVVCATSDAPAMLRIKAASTATSVAEYFRAQGQRVLLMMDSVTRLAQAQREIGLTVGEPPVRHGYPPSAFTLLPRLMERAGRDERGSITGIYTVLAPGDDMRDPIVDAVRAVLDGHIVLSRELAERAHWPAIDVNRSLSRLMSGLVEPDHQEASNAVRRMLATYSAHRDLITLGAYQSGDAPSLDEAIELMPEVEDFLCQGLDEHNSMEETLHMLMSLAAAPY